MTDTDSIARQFIETRDRGGQVPPGTGAALTMEAGYAVAARIHALRLARGERTVGRKIGFTNRDIWPTYGITTPLWNWVWQETSTQDASGTVHLPNLPEMLIEPEIVLGLRAPVHGGMDEAAIARAIGWVAAGFEIVTSLYPGWKLAAPQSAAAFGMHGHLFVGEKRPVTPEGLAERLAAVEATLEAPGGQRLHGRGANALGSPLTALRFLADTLAADPAAQPLAAGELVTTGTLLPPPPVRPGERWTYRISGYDLPGLDLTFA